MDEETTQPIQQPKLISARLGVASSLYLDPVKKRRLKELIGTKSLSQEVNELMVKRIAELEATQGLGQTANTEDYELLKRRQSLLLTDIESIEKRLTKKGYYDKLGKLALSIGLNVDCSNVNEVASKILESWKPSEYAHLFITMVEMARDLRAVERKLNFFRKLPQKQPDSK